MASNVTRDHHNLRRNLKLNGNYISNDGGDEGIRITDTGRVIVGGGANPSALFEVEQNSAGGGTAFKIDNNDTNQLAMSIEAANINVDVMDISADAVTTAKVIDITADALTSGSMLYLDDNSASTTARNCVSIIQNNDAALDATALLVQSDAGGTGMKIDKNYPAALVAADTVTGLHVDFVHTAPSSGTATMTDIGIDLDVTSGSIAGATHTTYGMDIDVVGATAGTHTATGIDITTSGADKHFGLKINNPNNTSSDGTEADFINYSSADPAEFFYINTIANGVTTLGTNDDSGTGGHLKLSPNGKVEINMSGGDTYAEFQKVTDYSRFKIWGYNQTTDYFKIEVEADAQTTITTFDDAGANADLVLNPDGDLIVDSHSGQTYFKHQGDADDYFKLSVSKHTGQTTLETVSADDDGHLTLDVDGNIVLDADGGNITLQDGGSTYTPTATSDATTKAYVDANQYHFIKCGFYSSSTAKLFIPIAGSDDQRELTNPTGSPEKVCMICPFNGSVETIWARSEEDCGSTVMGMHVGTIAAEIPSSTATQSVTVDMGTIDTSYEFDFAGAGTNTFSKGNILMFSVDPTSAMNDVHFMIILKYDVST